MNETILRLLGERDRARHLAAALEADNARLTVEAKVCREDAEENATRAERAQVRVADLERQNGLLLRQAEEHWGHRQRSEARVAELEAEVERLRDRALGDEQCCLDTCNGGACETCLGCAAGWCVNGHDFAADPDVWEQMMSEEDHQQWFDVAREHNRGIDAALIRAETAEARARRAENALQRILENFGGDPSRPLGPYHRAAIFREARRALSAAGQTSEHDCSTCTDCLHDGQRCCGCYDGACCQTSDATPSDTTDTLTIDPKRLTWDQRIPTAHEFGTWVESLPAGEFATGLLIIADALREREKAAPSDGGE